MEHVGVFSGVDEAMRLCGVCSLERQAHVESKCPFDASFFAEMTLDDEVRILAEFYIGNDTALWLRYREQFRALKSNQDAETIRQKNKRVEHELAGS